MNSLKQAGVISEQFIQWRRVAQLLALGYSNRKVAKPYFDSRWGSASLCPWERHLMSIPILRISSLPDVMAQPDDSVCVGVVWQIQSIVQYLVQTKKKFILSGTIYDCTVYQATFCHFVKV